jgi:hypothetical protein
MRGNRIPNKPVAGHLWRHDYIGKGLKVHELGRSDEDIVLDIAFLIESMEDIRMHDGWAYCNAEEDNALDKEASPLLAE